MTPEELETMMTAAFAEHEAAPRYLMLDAEGYVLNVVVGDPADCIHHIPECDLCVSLSDAPEGAGFGWKREADGTWTAPPEPEPDPET